MDVHPKRNWSKMHHIGPASTPRSYIVQTPLPHYTENPAQPKPNAGCERIKTVSQTGTHVGPPPRVIYWRKGDVVFHWPHSLVYIVKHYTNTELSSSIISTPWLIFSYSHSMNWLKNGHCLAWLLILLKNNLLVLHVVVDRYCPDSMWTLHMVLVLAKSFLCESLLLCIELVSHSSRLVQIWSLSLIIWYELSLDMWSEFLRQLLYSQLHCFTPCYSRQCTMRKRVY